MSLPTITTPRLLVAYPFLHWLYNLTHSWEPVTMGDDAQWPFLFSFRELCNSQNVLFPVQLLPQSIQEWEVGGYLQDYVFIWFIDHKPSGPTQVTIVVIIFQTESYFLKSKVFYSKISSLWQNVHLISESTRVL